MKFFIFLVLFFSFVFLSTGDALGHLAGQPPFFKINGIYSDLYDVPTTSLVELELPQDKSPALYVVNEEINFEIDRNVLPIPPEVLEMSEFQWDFGDGSGKKTGFVNTHSYSKAGSYILEITATTKGVSQPQLIQSNLVNIVPHSEYKMPKAKILVNGQSVEDPLLDDVEIEFGKDFELDASMSEVGSGEIVEYFWDLGDGKSARGEKVRYQYSTSQYAMFPVLRVKDENGLISDAFIQITNADESELFGQPMVVNQFYRNRYLIIGGAILAILIVISPIIIKLFKRKSS